MEMELSTTRVSINYYHNFIKLNPILIVLEFIAATMDAKVFMRDSYLKAAFNMFDADGSGKIDSTEINRLLSGDEFKDIYTADQLAEAIAEVDKNGDGEIDFEEFMEMMKTIK